MIGNSLSDNSNIVRREVSAYNGAPTIGAKNNFEHGAFTYFVIENTG